MATPTNTHPTTPADRSPRHRLPLAVGLDTASVVLFVALGRRSHDRDPAISGLLDTAAPFLVALVLGWLLARVWLRPTAIGTGLVVWATVVLAGMLIRRFAFDDGTAASFVVVATLFTGLFLVGWRAVFAVLDRRRSTTS